MIASPSSLFHLLFSGGKQSACCWGNEQPPAWSRLCCCHIKPQGWPEARSPSEQVDIALLSSPSFLLAPWVEKTWWVHLEGQQGLPSSPAPLPRGLPPQPPMPSEIEASPHFVWRLQTALCHRPWEISHCSPVLPCSVPKALFMKTHYISWLIPHPRVKLRKQAMMR